MTHVSILAVYTWLLQRRAGQPPINFAGMLQRVLHARVCLVTCLGPRDHITGTVVAIYWLSIEYRIKYKLCAIMHTAVSGQWLDCKVVMPLSSLPGLNRLRAAACGLYDVPHTRTLSAEQAFSVVSPQQWNDIPPDICNTTDRAVFKRALKSHFSTSLQCNVLTIGSFYTNLSDCIWYFILSHIVHECKAFLDIML